MILVWKGCNYEIAMSHSGRFHTFSYLFYLSRSLQLSFWKKIQLNHLSYSRMFAILYIKQKGHHKYWRSIILLKVLVYFALLLFSCYKGRMILQEKPMRVRLVNKIWCNLALKKDFQVEAIKRKEISNITMFM